MTIPEAALDFRIRPDSAVHERPKPSWGAIMENETNQDQCGCGCEVIALSAHRRDPWACYEDDQAYCENKWDPQAEAEDDCCCCCG